MTPSRISRFVHPAGRVLTSLDLYCLQAEIALDTRNIIRRNERFEIAQWITNITFDEDYKNARDQHTMFTRESKSMFLRRRAFKQWMTKSRNPVLWCYGDR